MVLRRHKDVTLGIPYSTEGVRTERAKDLSSGLGRRNLFQSKKFLVRLLINFSIAAETKSYFTPRRSSESGHTNQLVATLLGCFKHQPAHVEGALVTILLGHLVTLLDPACHCYLPKLWSESHTTPLESPGHGLEV